MTVVFGYAEQLGDHRDRQRRRIVGQQVAPAVPGHPVEQGVGDPLDRLTQSRDVTTGKGSLDQPAQPGVLRRLGVEDGVAVQAVEESEVGQGLAVAEDPAGASLPQHGIGVGMAQCQPEPQSVMP